MMTTKNGFSIDRINSDVNGNPRYVVHFLAFVNDLSLSVSEEYNFALSCCKKYHGKKYHNKKYGGGITFSVYNPEYEINKIIDDIEKEFIK